MKSVTRKDIRRDEFANAVGRGVEYAESHVRTIIYAVVGLVLLAAVVGAVSYWRGHQNQLASAALAKAVRVYQGAVVATGAKPDDPDEPSFPTEEARRAKARQALEKVRKDYGSTISGDVAGLYLAQIDADESKLADARKLWQGFVDDHSDHMLAAETRLNLLRLDRQEGKAEQVVTTLRGLLEKGDSPIPQDVVLHELGATLEQVNRPQEAVQAYQRILDEYPQSPFRGEAQQKVSALDPARAAAGAGSPLQGLPGFPG